MEEEEEKDLPECPVCLQTYDGEYTIPRVVPCGHTVCQTCLTNIPQIHSDTIRCPACTVLIKLPSIGGPSALPKNIDLLKFMPPSSQGLPKVARNHENATGGFFVPLRFSGEFYERWKERIFPHDAVSVEGGGNGGGFLRGTGKVRLLRLGSFLDDKKSGSLFKFSYVVRVMNWLSEMGEDERNELDLVLSVRHTKICKVLGLWGDLGDRFLYLVGESLNNDGFALDEMVGDIGEKDGVLRFSMMCMQLCEAVIGLHKEGLIMGCLGASCLKFDEFGNVYVDLIEVLEMGCNACRYVLEGAGSAGKKLGLEEMSELLSDLIKKEIFLSPEVLFKLLERQKIGVDGIHIKDSVSYSSDVWSLGCLLLKLLVGEKLTDELIDRTQFADVKEGDGNCMDVLSFYTSLVEKVGSLLESKFGWEFESVQKILCKCFNLDPQSRPYVTDLWKCARELIIQPRFNSMISLDNTYMVERKGQCLVLGKSCHLAEERSAEQGYGLKEIEDGAEGDSNQVRETRADKDFVKGLSEGRVKSKDLQGHLDCVTGLAIGGGFLFSSSFDKNLHVWSLQDFSHLHTFRGHEHKIMGVVYVDGAEPQCISGDGGGGIFVWSACPPFRQEPLRKWYEPKDWRYSGIHALTISENGYIYTGCGDKTIKAWSLRDGSLMCTLSGHKSVVSTLVVQNGVLYSGSWDGTIRLWSLSDHNLLTVLGEETPGSPTSVLSLTADQHTLLAAYENGTIKIWRNDVFMKSTKIHKGAIFAVDMDGAWLFTGGWDKTVNIQELTGDDILIDVTPVGSMASASAITSLLYWQGKLFVGYADRTIKVYYYGS